MKFTVLTLFPEMIESFCQSGLLGQAVKRRQIEIQTLNPRTFTSDAHHTVDDRVFGGGDGMVMKVKPLLSAIRQLRSEHARTRVVLLTPQGQKLEQKKVRTWAMSDDLNLVLVCGRYAGIDQRFSAFVDEEISLGDFILNGGELAACAVIESVSRLLPGVLGNSISAHSDSFQEGLLECPQFTRPREIEGMSVPATLLSGHHEEIRAFERTVARVRTALLRPDLLKVSAIHEREWTVLEKLEDSELKAMGLTRDQLKRRMI